MTADIIKPIAVTRMEMPTKIPTVQADTGRKIIFVMTDLDIPKGGTAQIFAIKPSGAEVYNNCAVGNLSTGASTVEVKLTSAMLEEPGEFPAQVQVVSGEDVITTFEFIISNARSLIKKGVTEGTNEYNALIQATKDAEDAARAANEATKKADTAAEDANDAASAASRAEINANNAASVANSAAGAANATVGPAVNATEAANDAAKAANEAAKKAEAAAGGEISEKTVTFQEAVERANIESGDTLSVAFGKLAKYCADFEKVVENVNELNTNTLVTGTFSECWFPGFAIDGMGFSVIIPKHYKSHTLTVSSAKIFVPVSATWVPTTVSSITELVNCWRVILTTDASMKLTNGSAYIANLGGQIK